MSLTFPSNIAPFIAGPHSVLVLESYNAMGGSGVSSAFLYLPNNSQAGVVISSKGLLGEVPNDRWAELMGVVEAAKIFIDEENGGGTWSRPQYVSCPTDVAYDLGPAQTKKDLTKFIVTGHEVYGDQPASVVHYYVNGTETTELEVPPEIEKMEYMVTSLSDEFLPRHPDHSPPIDDDLKKLVESVDNLARFGSHFPY
ncbi:hypothetical protein FB45DRAFT_1029286 [Roridomyces roridus]|uniref:Uncharacterized protein n=1 Tax=Roridomyces roridus TaxID=1738132 RepID=A0AAD7BPH4_9AGAR|nr:hypothetical protein FB45DRAFT_1029286 [Roridomyces roridus]